MDKQTINRQHTASYSQLNELLSVAANVDKAIIQKLGTKANAASLGAATSRIAQLETDSATKAELSDAITGATIVEKTTRQLAVMYFLPPYQEGKVYQKDMIIRMDGRVFKSLTDNNTQSPYTVVTDESGQIIVNENWLALITDDVNTDNWAQLDETLIPTMSMPDRMEVVEQRQEATDNLAEQTSAEMAALNSTNAAWRNSFEGALDAWKASVEASYQAQVSRLTSVIDTYHQQCEALKATVQTMEAHIAELENKTFIIK